MTSPRRSPGSLYAFLEQNGYERNRDIRVAGYDSRLTPDMDGFLERTRALIEETYRRNANTPVHLVGHSNGPLYAQYLLTHTSQEWKNTYIHGFTPIAGNWPGHGRFYSLYFTGLNITDFQAPASLDNAASSAAMYQSHPSSYMSSADPAVFQDQIVVVRARHSGIEYTPQDHQQLFRHAGLVAARELAAHYIGLVEIGPRFFPDVDVYAEKGSGIETVVGVELPDLAVGQTLDASTVFFTRDGDAVQPDLTNDAILAWNEMPCFRFQLTDNPGVNHFALPGDQGVLLRLLANLRRPRSVCRGSRSALSPWP